MLTAHRAWASLERSHQGYALHKSLLNEQIARPERNSGRARIIATARGTILIGLQSQMRSRSTSDAPSVPSTSGFVKWLQYAFSMYSFYLQYFLAITRNKESIFRNEPNCEVRFIQWHKIC